MVFYYSFDGVNGEIIEVQRDQDYIDKLIKKETEFYRCMMEFEAPPLTDKDYIERDDEEWKISVLNWMQAKKDLKILETQEKLARENLLSLCQSNSSKGCGVKVKKIIRKGSVNYSEIPELKNVNLNLYRNESKEIWQILENN